MTRFERITREGSDAADAAEERAGAARARGAAAGVRLAALREHRGHPRPPRESPQADERAASAAAAAVSARERAVESCERAAAAHEAAARAHERAGRSADPTATPIGQSTTGKPRNNITPLRSQTICAPTPQTNRPGLHETKRQDERLFRRSIGSAARAAVTDEAKREGCSRLWLITMARFRRTTRVRELGTQFCLDEAGKLSGRRRKTTETSGRRVVTESVTDGDGSVSPDNGAALGRGPLTLLALEGLSSTVGRMACCDGSK